MLEKLENINSDLQRGPRNFHKTPWKSKTNYAGVPGRSWGTEEAAAAHFPARELAGGEGDAGKRERGPRATPWWVESGSG